MACEDPIERGEDFVGWNEQRVHSAGAGRGVPARFARPARLWSAFVAPEAWSVRLGHKVVDSGEADSGCCSMPRRGRDDRRGSPSAARVILAWAPASLGWASPSGQRLAPSHGPGGTLQGGAGRPRGTHRGTRGTPSAGRLASRAARPSRRAGAILPRRLAAGSARARASGPMRRARRSCRADNMPRGGSAESSLVAAPGCAGTLAKPLW